MNSQVMSCLYQLLCNYFNCYYCYDLLINNVFILYVLDFCKSLSKSEALGELSSISSDDEESESEKGFHHPFLLKERPSSIIMNIRVSISNIVSINIFDL
jgi:hypothetical protein